MKTIIILILFIFSQSVISQEKLEFFGALKLNGDSKSMISYQLVFNVVNDKIVGYSVTDLGGVHETKNKISGTYNKKTKEFSFKEENILYTKSQYSPSMFCFVNFTNKIKLIDGSSKIEGPFNGLYKDNKKCLDGTITLIGSVKLFKMLEKINKKIKKIKKIDESVKEKINPISILDSLKVNNLIKDQNVNVFTKSDEIAIEIWDPKTEDGDVIDLFQDDVQILKNFTITNKKKIISIKLKQAKNVFKVIAINEGEIVPNTAKIQIIDKERNFELMTNLKKGEKASLSIYKDEN